jgi:nucleotide-binding universal stress UspA family protein
MVLEVAEEEDCDLVIVGAQKKKRGIKRLFGDRVVEKLIEQSPCPVLVV